MNKFLRMSREKIIALTILALFLATPVVSAEYNAPCQIDADCKSIYTDEYRCYNRHCMRKYFTYNTRELTGTVVVILIAMIANAGGLGAGAVIIPIYMFFYGFVATDAIPLSKITIFAGAVTNIAFNWNTRHIYNHNRFLINYNVASSMIPLLLAGTTIGVILSKFLPSIIITCGLIFYLILSILKLYKRGMKMHLAEIEEKKMMENPEVSNNLGTELKDFDGIDSYDGMNAELGMSGDKKPHINHSQMSAVQREQIDEARQSILSQNLLPTMILVKKQSINFMLMILSYFVILVAALVRGGEGKPSILGVKRCTGESWITLVASQFLCGLISFTAYRANQKLLDEDDAKTQNNESVEEARSKRNNLLIASYFTGIAAGTLGIGGGMILGPFMIAMNMDPQISTALSAFTVLFTSSSTTLQFTIAGAVHMEHAWLFMLLSLIGSIIGNFGLRALIRHYNKPSLLIWIIFGILCLAGLVLPGQMISSALSGKKSLLDFGDIC